VRGTLSTATSRDRAGKNAGVLLISKNRVSECFHELDLGHVEAVTTDAAILAAIW